MAFQMNIVSVFSDFIKSDYNRDLFSYFFIERKVKNVKQKMDKQKRPKKFKAVTRQKRVKHLQSIYRVINRE